MRMEWGWVGKYPIFVYMTFIDHGKWEVKVVRGKKGDQNAGNTSPSAKAWFEYKCEGKISRFDVFQDAQRRARERL